MIDARRTRRRAPPARICRCLALPRSPAAAPAAMTRRPPSRRGRARRRWSPGSARRRGQRGLDFAHRTGARRRASTARDHGTRRRPGRPRPGRRPRRPLRPGRRHRPGRAPGGGGCPRVCLNQLVETGALGFVPGPAIESRLLRPGGGGRGLRRRRAPRPLPDGVRLVAPAAQPRRRQARGRDCAEPDRRRRLERAGGLLRLRPRRPARPLRRPLPRFRLRQPTCRAGVTGRPSTTARPTAYRALPDRLFRNRGDGTFSDVTARRHRPRLRPGPRRRSRPTSTATAGSTSTWPTTASRTSCG